MRVRSGLGNGEGVALTLKDAPPKRWGFFVGGPMKIHISPAIIMRVKEVGETDLLVSFFSWEGGRLKGLAKGARKSQRRFVNCFGIFSLVKLEYELKRPGSVHFLHSGKLLDGFPGLRSDYASLSKASYMVEMTEVLFPWGVVDHEMFQLLKESFQQLAQGDKANKVHLVFETRAMSLGGFGINLEKCCMCGRRYTGAGMAVFIREKGGIACQRCQQPSAVSPEMNPGTVKTMKLMQSMPINELKGLEFGEEIRKEIKLILTLHREYRLEQRLKTSKYVEG